MKRQEIILESDILTIKMQLYLSEFRNTSPWRPKQVIYVHEEVGYLRECDIEAFDKSDRPLRLIVSSPTHFSPRTGLRGAGRNGSVRATKAGRPSVTTLT